MSERRTSRETALTLAYQQAAVVAEFGQRALTHTNLTMLLNDAVILLARTLHVEFTEVLELLAEGSVPEASVLVLKAGTGWSEGDVGHVTVSSGTDSPAGYALASREPVVVEDLRKEVRFSEPPLLRKHGIVSGMSLIIEGRERPYGVLGVHTVKRREFTENDTNFLQAIATVLGMAIERQRIEEELKKSEERFEATFEQAAVGIGHVALEGNWLRVNSKLCEILGYTREELLEKTSQDITHPKDLEKDLEQARRLLSGTTGTYSTEKRYFRKDGSVVWVNFTGSLVRDSSGKPAYLNAAIENLHESKRARESLLRLRERAITASTNSIVITDPTQTDNPIVYVNPAFEQTTGYRAEEAVGRNCRFLQSDDREQSALKDLKTALHEGRHCTVVLRNYRKDGTRFWNELSVYPVRDEYGRVTNFVGVQNDITERHRAEEALSEMRRAERRRIARDLHDIVLQDLSGALQSLRLTQLRSKGSGLTLGLEEELEALGRATSGLRSAIYDLRHEKERPFVESVESLVELNRQAAAERKLGLAVE